MVYKEYLSKALSCTLIARQAINNYQNNYKNIVQIYTHDIEKLIKNYCKPYGIYVPQKIILNSKLYTSWEAESRYSLSYSVRIDSINTALNEIEKWIIKIKPRYKSNINRARLKLNL